MYSEIILSACHAAIPHSIGPWQSGPEGMPMLLVSEFVNIIYQLAVRSSSIIPRVLLRRDCAQPTAVYPPGGLHAPDKDMDGHKENDGIDPDAPGGQCNVLPSGGVSEKYRSRRVSP